MLHLTMAAALTGLTASLSVLQKPQFEGELGLVSAIIRCVVEFTEEKYGRKDEEGHEVEKDWFGEKESLVEVGFEEAQTVENQGGESDIRNCFENNTFDIDLPKDKENEKKQSELTLHETDQNVLTLHKLEQDISNIEKHLVSQINDEQQITSFFKINKNDKFLENKEIKEEQYLHQLNDPTNTNITRTDEKVDQSEEFPPLKCPECDFETFLAIHELQEHMTVNHHVCDVCGEKRESENDLKSHYTIHTNSEGKYTCPFVDCTYTYRLRLLLQNHVNFYHNGVTRKYKIARKQRREKTTCNICQKTLIMRHMKAHMKAKHGDNPLLFCTECEYSSKYQYNIKSHMQNIHTSGDPLLCTKCDFETFSKKNLKRHEIKHEKPQKERVRKRQEGKEHVKKVKDNPVVICPICPFKAKEQSMKLHDEMHSRGGLLNCNMCDYKTGNRYELKKHIKVKHEGGDEYKCKEEGCGFKGPPYDLKVHRARHNKEYSIKCDKCSYSTNHIKNLKSHSYCHGKPNYVCNLCDYKTWNSANFSTHKVTKHGSIEYTCEKCDFVTKSRRTSRQHKMKHEEFETYLEST